MNISDEIQGEINKAEKLTEDIKSNLQKRSEKSKKRMNTSSDEAKIKFQLDNFLNTINHIKLKLGTTLISSENQQLKHQINKFYSAYGEFKKLVDKFSTEDDFGRFSNSFNKTLLPLDDNKNMGKQQYEVYKEQKLKESEEVFDELKGTAKRIKTGAIQIKDEIDLQNPLLDRLERNIDKVESKMKRSENKLANYLQKSSNTCLYWTILAEFVVLLLFFAF